MKDKEITIIKAIKLVLKDFDSGASIDTIYDEILKRDLYSFGAKNPKGVVNGEIRRHCYGLDFPTSNPVKHFYIKGLSHGKPLYGIYDNSNLITSNLKQTKLENNRDELPEEKVEKTINSYNDSIKNQLMERIMTQDPSFFEQLVVQLLLKMGYGYDGMSGTVVGRSHDGGIDGIISEDKLGLDQIYIQAKRYAKNNTVGRKELQAFIGAMEGNEKGVFITTSSYTKEALSYIEKIHHKHVKLINGEALLGYMLKYEIGVQTLKEYKILKIDEDYFN